eukprot:TRINITY_DN8702_c0_g1_i8.p1 TRINITY_DN8702_c0_g1~~TRINITY_DN8702_c0_g1_i8.p1  ORF type:complete len:342 (-),score=46.50 TRINITY_DN8702_c0_g1_i8:325-1350(-)
MALPSDFWHNEQQLNIFRTKACQRLARDGVCEWKSRCQFSHTVDWPRRPPQKYRYSPQLCPHVQYGSINKDGSVGFASQCVSGLACPFAHSLEEVLFHPQVFKTILCEEYANNSQRGSRRAKRGRCHRYYCPFAHSTREQRMTDLPADVREMCVKVLELCPSEPDECCKVCRSHRFTSSAAVQRDNTERHQRFSGSQLSTSGSSASSSPQLSASRPPPGTFVKDVPPQLPPPQVSLQQLWAQLHLQSSIAAAQPYSSAALAAFSPPARDCPEVGGVGVRMQPPATAVPPPMPQPDPSACPFLLPPPHFEASGAPTKKQAQAQQTPPMRAGAPVPGCAWHHT